MKKQNLYSIIICILFFQGCFSQQDKLKVLNPSIVSDYSQDYSQEHIQFIKSFYNEYIIGTSLDVQKDGKNVYDNYNSILKKYCTKSLIKKIAEKPLSELSYDPFIYAQDVWAGVLEFLEVEKVADSVNKYIVSYRYNENGGRIRIKLEVVNTDDGFKINGVGGFYQPEFPQEDMFIRGD